MPPGFVVILVGSDAASQVYVRNKVRVCDLHAVEGNAATLTP